MNSKKVRKRFSKQPFALCDSCGKLARVITKTNGLKLISHDPLDGSRIRSQAGTSCQGSGAPITDNIQMPLMLSA